MKAVVVTAYGAPEVLKVSTVPIPKPGPRQVLVKIKAAGVNPVETYKRSGNYAAAPALPWTPGTDGAGVIEALGEGVSNLSVGDRVWLSGCVTGTYAQFSVSDETDAHPLPPNVSFEQGSALWIPYATAYHALHHIGRPQERSTASAPLNVFVHGASGGVGMAALQFAKQLPNVVVFGTAGTPEGLEAIAKNGATHALNHREEGYLDKVGELTEGRGVDLILEMLANVNLSKDCKILAIGGRICVIGNRGSIDFNPRDLMQKRSEVRGVMLGLTTQQEREEIIAAINKGLESGLLNPIVSKTYSFSNAPQAHIDVISSEKGSLGKLVLTPWEE